MYLFLFSLAFVCLLLLPVGQSGKDSLEATANLDKGWVMLFNGKDLSGWKQVNRTAPSKMEGGAIVGVTVPDSSISFLAAENE